MIALIADAISHIINQQNSRGQTPRNQAQDQGICVYGMRMQIVRTPRRQWPQQTKYGQIKGTLQTKPTKKVPTIRFVCFRAKRRQLIQKLIRAQFFSELKLY